MKFFDTFRSATEACPGCGLALRLLHADSALSGQVREIARCPRCGHEEFRGLVPAWIEADPDYFLHLRPLSKPTPHQLQALRTVAPEWQALPLATLKSRLATATLVKLGPYHRKYPAEDARRRLEAAGWECSFEYV